MTAETLPPAVVEQRPFFRDPVWLIAAGYFVFTFVEAMRGGWSWPEVRAALVAAAIATFRVAAPYVQSFVPWLDRNNPGSPRK